MSIDKEQLMEQAEGILTKFATIQERSEDINLTLPWRSDDQRVALVAACELGNATEELLHIALKCIGLNPTSLQVHTFNLDTTLNDWALTCERDDRHTVATLIADLADAVEVTAAEHNERGDSDHPESHDAEAELARLLPWVEASHAHLSERLASFRAPLPLTLRCLALAECSERLLAQCGRAIAAARDKFSLDLPSREALEQLERQAVADSDLHAIFTIEGLQKAQEHPAEVAAALEESLKPASASTKYGFVLAAAKVCEVTARVLDLLESDAAGA